jgi:hypothetical protein
MTQLVERLASASSVKKSVTGGERESELFCPGTAMVPSP